MIKTTKRDLTLGLYTEKLYESSTKTTSTRIWSMIQWDGSTEVESELVFGEIGVP